MVRTCHLRMWSMTLTGKRISEYSNMFSMCTIQFCTLVPIFFKAIFKQGIKAHDTTESQQEFQMGMHHLHKILITSEKLKVIPYLGN